MATQGPDRSRMGQGWNPLGGWFGNSMAPLAEKKPAQMSPAMAAHVAKMEADRKEIRALQAAFPRGPVTADAARVAADSWNQPKVKPAATPATTAAPAATPTVTPQVSPTAQAINAGVHPYALGQLAPLVPQGAETYAAGHNGGHTSNANWLRLAESIGSLFPGGQGGAPTTPHQVTQGYGGY